MREESERRAWEGEKRANDMHLIHLYSSEDSFEANFAAKYSKFSEA